MFARRSTSPEALADLLAPISKYKVSSAANYDEGDPFHATASSCAPKETGTDRDVDSGSGSDLEMPGISEILAEKEARESQRAQKVRLQQLKLAAIAQQQQKKASTSAGFPSGVEEDSDDDALDVVPDTMHSVAREEAAARAAARHSCVLPASQLRPSEVMRIPSSPPPMSRRRNSWRPLRSPHSFPHLREEAAQWQGVESIMRG